MSDASMDEQTSRDESIDDEPKGLPDQPIAAKAGTSAYGVPSVLAQLA